MDDARLEHALSAWQGPFPTGLRACTVATIALVDAQATDTETTHRLATLTPLERADYVVEVTYVAEHGVGFGQAENWYLLPARERVWRRQVALLVEATPRPRRPMPLVPLPQALYGPRLG